jgi:hypothetical protein
LADGLQEPIVVADGYDAALLGTAEVFTDGSWVTRAVYDTHKVLRILVERDGMAADEACEYFEFNIQGAVIAGGPIFVSRLL